MGNNQEPMAVAVGMHSLPQEIVAQIFDHVLHGLVWITRLKRQKAIQTLRLVNRQWSALASRHLLSDLRIELDEESLATAEGLSNNPDIALGITGVHLILEHYPEVFANSHDGLRELQRIRIRELADGCKAGLEAIEKDRGYETERFESKVRYDESSWRTTYDNQKPTTTAETKKRYLDALARCNALLDAQDQSKPAWYLYLKRKPERNQTSVYQLLEKVTKRLQKKTMEQKELIHSGRFAERVALIMTRLTKVQNILFVDQGNGFHDAPDNPLKAAYTVLNDEELCKMVSGPMDWNWPLHQIKSLGNVQSVQVDAAALLWDVPVAMARVGVYVGQLSTLYWPFYANVAHWKPEDCFLQGTAHEVNQVMNALERFVFIPREASRHYAADYLQRPQLYVNRKRRNAMMPYLEACLSGSNLQRIVLDGAFNEVSRSSSNNDDDDENEDEGIESNRFITDDLLFTVRSNNLNYVNLDGLALSSEAMLHLVKRLSTEAFQLSVGHVELSDGCWHNTVQRLRSNYDLSPDSKQQKDVDFGSLSGGYAQQLNFRLWNPEHPFRLAVGSTDAIQSGLAIRLYVEGQVDLNPFDPSCL